MFPQMMDESAWSGQTNPCCAVLDPDLHLADPDLPVALATLISTSEIVVFLIQTPK